MPGIFGGSTITDAGQISDGVITNAKINAAAAIALSKIANLQVLNTVCPRPIGNATPAGTDVTVNSNTTGYTGCFVLEMPIVVNKITIKTGGTITTAGTVKIGIYSEDGQTKEIDVTTNSLNAASTLFTTTVPGVTLQAGVHYIVIVPVGTTNVTLNMTRQGIGGANWTIASEPAYEGTQTVTAGTLPTTFNPTTLTYSDNRTVNFRLDT